MKIEDMKKERDRLKPMLADLIKSADVARAAYETAFNKMSDVKQKFDKLDRAIADAEKTIRLKPGQSGKPRSKKSEKPIDPKQALKMLSKEEKAALLAELLK